MTKLPEHYFSPNFNLKYQQEFLNILNSYKFADTPLPFTNFDIKIDKLRQDIINYFKETISLDVSARLLNRSKIHFQDPDLFINTVKRLNEPTKKVRGYFSVNTHHIFLTTTNENGVLRNEGSLLKSLCHELIHGLSFKYYDILNENGKKEIFLIRQGFGACDTLDWDYMMEGYIEIIISEICRIFIKNDHLLLNDFRQTFTDELTGYWDNVIILRAIIDKGKSLKINGQELFDNLSRDFLMGEDNGIKIIENIIGNDYANLYKGVSSKNRKIKDIIELANSINLAGLASKIRNLPNVEKRKNSELFKFIGVNPFSRN